MAKIDSLQVSVAGRPDLSYVRGSLSFHAFGITILRLEREEPESVSKTGAHLSLLVSSALLAECFERERSEFRFEGTRLGALTERDGRDAYEYGGFLQHAVTTLTLTAETDLRARQFRLSLIAGLSPMRQSKKDWQVPEPLSEVRIDADFAFDAVAAFFYGQEAQKREQIGAALARLAEVRERGDV